MPTWVDVKPSDFVSAEEAGAQAGNRHLQTISENELQRQQLQQQMSVATMDAANRAAQNEREFQMRSQELAVDSAYKMQQLGLQKSQLDLDTQQAAQKFQATQQYQQLVAGGVDPVQAALQVGPALLGESIGGLGTLRRAQTLEWQDATKTVDDQVIHGQRNINTGEFKAYTGEQKPETDLQKENVVLRLQNRRDAIIRNNPQWAEKLDAGDDADPSWSKQKQSAYKAIKGQLDDLDKKIDQYSGGAAPSGGSGNTGTTSSGLNYTITPAQ